MGCRCSSEINAMQKDYVHRNTHRRASSSKQYIYSNLKEKPQSLSLKRSTKKILVFTVQRAGGFVQDQQPECWNQPKHKKFKRYLTPWTRNKITFHVLLWKCYNLITRPSVWESYNNWSWEWYSLEIAGFMRLDLFLSYKPQLLLFEFDSSKLVA